MFIKYNGSSPSLGIFFGKESGRYGREPAENMQMSRARKLKLEPEPAKRGGDGHGVGLPNSHYLHTSAAYDVLMTFLSSVSGKSSFLGS